MARLASAWASTAPAASCGGQGQRPVVELVGGDDLVDEAHRQRLRGADLAAAHDEVLGLGRADQAGQALGAAAAGDDAEQHLRLAELRLLAGDPEVAGERQLAAAAEGEAGDRGDGGAGIVGHRVEGPVEAAAQRETSSCGITGVAAPELRDLGAGREEPIAAGDDHRAGRVGLQAEGDRLELASSACDSALTFGLLRRDHGDAVVPPLDAARQR